MGKISPVSSKYIVHAQIQIDGVVDKPDVVGSVFGQTEGLLGEDLELRELQRSGRIGRIEVDIDTKSGKTIGVITIPSSLDKTETTLIAAALETIERIGPCNARVNIQKLEDVRITKRNQLVERAKELLHDLAKDVLPDSGEIKSKVSDSVRMMEISEYGPDRLPAGPHIDISDEVILVEGRADVLNLLRNDIKNVIAMNGTSIPQTIIDLSKKKVVTVFVDGDRGGDLIIRELAMVADIDYVTKAPAGKEVEEITKKEIHKALRSKVAAEQVKLDIERAAHNNHATRRDYTTRRDISQPQRYTRHDQYPRRDTFNNRDRDFSRRRAPFRVQPRSVPILSSGDMTNYKNMLEDLIGTKGAYILDEGKNILGKVPTTELDNTIKNLDTAHTIVFDGNVTKDILSVAEEANIKYLVAMDSDIGRHASRVTVVTNRDLVSS